MRDEKGSRTLGSSSATRAKPKTYVTRRAAAARAVINKLIIDVATAVDVIVTKLSKRTARELRRVIYGDTFAARRRTV